MVEYHHKVRVSSTDEYVCTKCGAAFQAATLEWGCSGHIATAPEIVDARLLVDTFINDAATRTVQ